MKKKWNLFVSLIDLMVMKTLLTARLPVTGKRANVAVDIRKEIFARTHSYPQADICSAPYSDHDGTHLIIVCGAPRPTAWWGKKSVTTYFSPCIDEDNKKKNRNKIRAKIKTLEAEPFDQNAENWKRENDCLHRPCSRPVPPGKIESVCTHSEVIEQFNSFRCSNSCFFSCFFSFPRRMTPESREKTAKTAVFRHRWRAWKVVRSITAVRQRPRMPRNLRCSFAFFESFLWHFNKKQRAEAIFRLSRPVSCKNQENGSGNHWSLHTPHKLILYKTVNLAFLECSSPGLVKVCCWNGERFLEYLTSFRLRQDPLIWVFGHIWLFAPWYIRSGEASSVKIK